MLQYNTLLYGEVRRMGGPKRRWVMVHGSPSVGACASDSGRVSICTVVHQTFSSQKLFFDGHQRGATLSLQDAGVPLKALMTGIAMGLIESRNLCGSRILDEDHLNMDFWWLEPKRNYRFPNGHQVGSIPVRS